MTTQAKVILWIGLILIAANLVRQWQQIRSIIFTKGITAGGGGGLSVNPLNPFLPGFPIPFPTLINAQGTPTQHRATLA